MPYFGERGPYSSPSGGCAESRRELVVAATMWLRLLTDSAIWLTTA